MTAIESILKASAELSRGEDEIGLRRAKLAFQSLADSDDSNEVAEIVALVLLGYVTRSNQLSDRNKRRGRQMEQPTA